MKIPDHGWVEWWPQTLPLPKLIDKFDALECSVWLALVEEGGEHLYLERVGDEEVGEMPRWLECELDVDGWDMLPGLGDSYAVGFNGYARWGLKNGIAPYQPFLVWFERPRYYRCSYEYDEWDADWTWDIKEVLPISDFDAERRWEHYLRDRFIAEEMMTHEASYWEHQHRIRVDCMAIHTEVLTSYRNDMHSPNGIRLTIRSSITDWRGGWHTADLLEASVREHNSSYEDHKAKAMTLLVEKAKEKLPHLTETQIRNMKVAKFRW